MSQSDSDEINRREVAYRLFAAEFEDADYSYAESDEERAPNYVVTPTGARVNRLFVVGVLTEVEQVSEEVVRARVVDPTGAFVIYAGQYQPEALAALESAETPSFVAVTGKARTFQPDDADVIYTSIRPEEVSEVDAETRDRWVVTTAERTVDRVATMAAAHERVERGDNLRDILEAAGVQDGLAAGIPLALDHYETTPAYLDAVRELALDAARVVAGETTEAGELSLSPSGGGDVPLPFAADLDVDESAVEAAAGGTDQPDAGQTTEPSVDDGASEPGDGSGDTTDAESGGETLTEESTDDAEIPGEDEAEPEPTEDEPVDAGPAAETPDPGDVAEEAAPAGDESVDEADASGDDDLYELSEDEREEVKENYDVEFSTGTEIPESPEDEGEAEPESEDTAVDADDADTEATSAADDTGEELGDFDAGDEEVETGDEEVETGDEEVETGDDEFDADDEAFDESQEDPDTSTDFTEDEYDEPESDASDAEGSEPDLDIEDYVVDLMESLDDGDGARREDVVASAADDLDADEGEIEDAIQDALMSGRCYESGDDHLKAI